MVLFSYINCMQIVSLTDEFALDLTRGEGVIATGEFY